MAVEILRVNCDFSQARHIHSVYEWKKDMSDYVVIGVTTESYLLAETKTQFYRPFPHQLAHSKNITIQGPFGEKGEWTHALARVTTSKKGKRTIFFLEFLEIDY